MTMKAPMAISLSCLEAIAGFDEQEHQDETQDAESEHAEQHGAVSLG
jgi:hypothetical protein